ncbi:gastrula zinc finger protein XlCGF26.1-like [Trichoplusia ni]|uniref:Gastrula zinc finger protein XlCGF26.1-like n=1 Tax=Trichoplusia ni TaxID=7111 RepID=A0A7E5WMN5_TRINI|nr:gastrula zinc finger protein XlCGF26.1-like [Trichoplusia ni]
MENLYCRFCAEPKSSEKLLNLQNDAEKHDEIILKLAFVNAVYVNVTNSDMLPKTICFICYNSLNKAYEFLDGVKRAQDVLSNIFTAINETKDDLSDDDRIPGFDDFLGNDDSAAVKTEGNTSSNHIGQHIVDVRVQVKQELKEEASDGEDQSNYVDALNVHDILNAAICNASFTSNVYEPATIHAKEIGDLSKKVVRSWKEYPWVCGYCNIEFLNIDMLRSHCKVVHGKCSAFMCIDCKAGRNEDFTSFMKHVRKHRKMLRNHCYYCDLILDKTDSLTNHIKQHFQKSQLPCPLCGEILENEESLKIHVQDFNTIKQKRRPRRKPGTPITVEDLTCELCKKVYKNPNSLRDHMKLHTIDRKRNYTCDRCGKMFYNKGTLTSHILSHDKNRPHVCRICNKSFLYPNMLRRHVEMHSGIKPYSCEQCGRCFRLQYQLNAHKIIHTDSMPYVCSYCNKAFRFKQILKNHERQHTGAKPYSCQHCGMEFTNWSNYNKHMKRRHNTDTSKKKITPEGVFPVNPETGQIMQVQDPAGTEEWKTKIMIPGKRGKKKVIKQENI